MSDYWFKPHAYGYGATPTNWKGWAAVLGYVAVILALALSLAALPADLPEGPGAWQAATSAILIAASDVWVHPALSGEDGWRMGLALGEAALRARGNSNPALSRRLLRAREGGSGERSRNAPGSAKGLYRRRRTCVT